MNQIRDIRYLIKLSPTWLLIIFQQPYVRIRSCLVHIALKRNSSLPAGTFSCGQTRCNPCVFLSQTTVIFGFKSKCIIGHNFTCTSSNIAYCISCSKCYKLYIGETGRRLSDSGKATGGNGGPDLSLFIKTNFVIILNPMENCLGGREGMCVKKQISQELTSTVFQSSPEEKESRPIYGIHEFHLANR